MIRTDKEKEVRTFLSQEYYYNFNILNALDAMSECEREIFVDNEEDIGVVLVHTGYLNYLYAQDLTRLESVKLFINDQPEGIGFSGVKKEIYEKLMQWYEKEWTTSCILYILPDEVSVEAGDVPGLTELRPDDAAQINRYYTYRSDSSYINIRKNILKRPALGIRVSGELRSWLLIHEDGSMGIMYTKKAYRKLGYGYQLTQKMISRLRQESKIPFVQISDDNTASIGLAEKSGFEKIGEVMWFGIKLHGNID